MIAPKAQCATGKNGADVVIIKNRTVGYSAVQGFFWTGYAGIMGFCSVYLLYAGFSNSQVGLLIAAAGLLSALLQPVAASYADRPGGIPLKWIVFLTGAVNLTCGLVMCLAGRDRIAAGMCYGVCMVLLQMTTPLVNSMGIATVNGGERMNFGVARGFGSLGYGASAYLIGVLVRRFGEPAVPVSMVAGLVLLLLFVADYPNPRPAQGEKAASAPQGGFLRRYPRFCCVLVGLVLIFISHAVLNSFTYQIVVYKGGDSQHMGTAMFLASLMELPVMFLFGWMQRKVRCDIWFRVSGIFFLLKTLGTWLCADMAGFYAVQLCQMGGFALMTVSSVFYINSLMSPGDSVKGQACFTVTMTLGNVLGAIVAGRILDSIGVPAMLLFATVCAFLGAVIVLAFTQKTRET